MAKQATSASAPVAKAPVAAAATQATASRKTVCAIERADFQEHAKPITAKIGENMLAVNVKEFSTGSFGWYANGKAVIEVNGIPVSCQVAVTITAVGSKELE